MFKMTQKKTFLILHDFTFELRKYVHTKECMHTCTYQRDIAKLNIIATLEFEGFLTLSASLINHKLLKSMKWP
jgi:hypothetical protein